MPISRLSLQLVCVVIWCNMQIDLPLMAFRVAIRGGNVLGVTRNVRWIVFLYRDLIKTRSFADFDVSARGKFRPTSVNSRVIQYCFDCEIARDEKVTRVLLSLFWDRNENENQSGSLILKWRGQQRNWLQAHKSHCQALESRRFTPNLNNLSNFSTSTCLITVLESTSSRKLKAKYGKWSFVCFAYCLLEAINLEVSENQTMKNLRTRQNLWQVLALIFNSARSILRISWKLSIGFKPINEIKIFARCLRMTLRDFVDSTFAYFIVAALKLNLRFHNVQRQNRRRIWCCMNNV